MIKQKNNTILGLFILILFCTLLQACAPGGEGGTTTANPLSAPNENPVDPDDPKDKIEVAFYGFRSLLTEAPGPLDPNAANSAFLGGSIEESLVLPKDGGAIIAQLCIHSTEFEYNDGNLFLDENDNPISTIIKNPSIILQSNGTPLGSVNKKSISGGGNSLDKEFSTNIILENKCEFGAFIKVVNSYGEFLITQTLDPNNTFIKIEGLESDFKLKSDSILSQDNSISGLLQFPGVDSDRLSIVTEELMEKLKLVKSNSELDCAISNQCADN